MIKRPFNQLRDTAKKNVKHSKELQTYLYEKSDSITLWIIGFSVGAVSLLIVNFKDLKKIIGHTYFHPIIFLLVLSVICGILYRYWFLFLYKKQSDIFEGLAIAFSRQDSMDTESRLNGNESYEEIMAITQATTGTDYSHWIEVYNKSDSTIQKVMLASAVDFYNQLVKFAIDDTERGLQFMAETYSIFYGKSKEWWYKTITGKARIKVNYMHLVLVGRLFFIIYIISFLTAIILFFLSV